MKNIQTSDLSLLVIDKDRTRRSMFSTHLEPYTVQTTGSYHKGLHILKQSSIDLVIVQVVVSNDASQRFLLAFSKMEVKLPCLALFGGNESTKDILATRDLGVTDFLFLPLDWEGVHLRIKWHVAHLGFNPGIPNS